MKKNDVPQDDSPLESKNIKELCYAVNENGEYTTVQSTGWEPKTIALQKALEVLEERTAQAKKEVLAGEASPIKYYMERHKMDIPILAAYVGLWQWRVKRHLKPKVFERLSPKLLQKYAEVFDISVEELRTVNK